MVPARVSFGRDVPYIDLFVAVRADLSLGFKIVHFVCFLLPVSDLQRVSSDKMASFRLWAGAKAQISAFHGSFQSRFSDGWACQIAERNFAAAHLAFRADQRDGTTIYFPTEGVLDFGGS